MKSYKFLKSYQSILILSFVCYTFFSSCKNEKIENIKENGIKKDSLTIKLNSIGFDTSEGLIELKDGYLVEYDIFLPKRSIDSLYNLKNMVKKIPLQMHYRANNIVINLPRNVNVYVDPALGTNTSNNCNLAIARYNAQNLALKFQRTVTSSNANISLLPYYQDPNNPNDDTLLGFSDYPNSSTGAPGPTIRLNVDYFNDNSQRNDAVTTISHEIGHAIGFRHTDFMDRTFSNCAVDASHPANEGQGNQGAVYIPNTPTSPGANSWMLACSNGNDRPFTQEDISALQSLYSCGSYFPQITSSTVDGVPFQYGTALTTGYHFIEVRTIQSASLFCSVVSGNMTISSQNRSSGYSGCSVNYNGGPINLRVDLANLCYNRFQNLNFSQK